MTIVFSGHTFKYEIESLCKAFFPVVRFALEYDTNDLSRDELLFTRRVRGRTYTWLYTLVRLDGQTAHNCERLENADSDYENECERLLAATVYRALSTLLGQSTEWGTLTGIRPVSQVSRRLAEGMTPAQCRVWFRERYLTSDRKIDLCLATAKTQEPILPTFRPRSYSLYISIPFCPTRCAYCSFVSHSITGAAAKRLVPTYIDRLCEELEATALLAQKLGLALDTVYFGGGTPTAISAQQLSRLFDAVRRHFPLEQVREFTVEAGRPDTITEEKLAAIREGGATRISINPQTFSDAVLETIGRRHTTAQTEEAFALARRMGFDCINMDLIAGLPSDTREEFRYAIDRAIALGPENITVHTLSIKRSSRLYEELQAIHDPRSHIVAEMVNYANTALTQAGFRPYYLYRQKNTLENQENVGWSKSGAESLYNIAIMEEIQTILAVGAGGSTKLYDPETGYIERVFNYKYPFEYIDRFSNILERKDEVEAFYGKHFAD